MNDDNTITYFKGRGAQIKPRNKFLKQEYVEEHIEGLDEALLSSPNTQVFIEHPKKIINKVDSPDLGLMFSMNPYQGCEHGCIYCYARNTHPYWGFSAGLDFESKIIAKPNAAELLEKELQHPKHRPFPIMLSGNTDCYQPLESKMRITRQMLEVLLKYKHPVGMITKNSLILRDLDILAELASLHLVHVSITITTLNEELRRVMEPRTASSLKRLNTVKELTTHGIPVNVMMAPIIPSLNSDEIPAVLKAASEHGALDAHFTIVRLNGDIAQIFQDWVRKNFPDRAEKVLHHIADCHGGKLNDSRFGVRMQGDGKIAESIHSLFAVSKNKYFKDKQLPEYNLSLFNNSRNKEQLKLF
ncbi:MAG: PA0069 family radical SAM protein [Chitinophagales bacterium]|nr:PA0069 family radical SAM protein [Chitinophagales bacterium]